MLITAERDGYFGWRAKPALGPPWKKSYGVTGSGAAALGKAAR